MPADKEKEEGGGNSFGGTYILTKKRRGR